MSVIILIAIIAAQVYLGSHFLRHVYHSLVHKPVKKALVLAAAAGFLAVGIAILLEQLFIPPVFFRETHTHIGIFGGMLLVGIIEEGAKSLPLALIIYGRKYFARSVDGLLYFGLSGFMFGAIEDMIYTFYNGAWTGVLRILTGVPAHVAYAALIGYGLGQRKEFKKPWALVLLYVIAAVLLHAFWDYFVFIPSAMNTFEAILMVLLLNFGVFQLYRVSREEDKDLALRLAVEHANCARCGFRNVAAAPVCAQCGNPLATTTIDLPTVTQSRVVVNGQSQLAVDDGTAFHTIQPLSNKRYLVAYLLSFFFGWLGIDRFYLHKIGTGLLKLFTLGGLGIWYLIDLGLLMGGWTKDKYGRKLASQDHDLKITLSLTFLSIMCTGVLLVFQ